MRYVRAEKSMYGMVRSNKTWGHCKVGPIASVDPVQKADRDRKGGVCKQLKRVRSKVYNLVINSALNHLRDFRRNPIKYPFIYRAAYQIISLNVLDFVAFIPRDQVKIKYNARKIQTLNIFHHNSTYHRVIERNTNVLNS